MATRPAPIHLDIKQSDHINFETSDELCSRCRKPVRDDQVPLRVWSHDGKHMRIYCQCCSQLVLAVK